MSKPYKVYHVPRELFREVLCTRGEKLLELTKNYVDTYDLVAEVRTDSPSNIFKLTNTIEREWWLNEEVTHKFEAAGCRSTSVGDVIEYPNGQRYLVDSFGFTAIK